MLGKLSASIKNIKNINTIVTCAVLMGFSIVLSMFNIYFGNFLKFSFGYLGTSIASFIFGPIVGAIFGGMLDILQHLIKPNGAYFFGFTFNGILNGLIYGIVLYKTPITFKNILISRTLVGIIVSMFFGTLWLDLIYGKSFFTILPLRVLKELIIIPIHSIVLYKILKTLNPKVY